MNPLDPLELSSFDEKLMYIMPQQTETTLKIPQIMYGNMPKNLGELKNKRFEKTLNKYQHIIEEIVHRDKNNFYGEWLKQYSKKYFIESIGHDSNSFFRNTILPDFSDIRQIGRQHNNPKISFGKINGSTITVSSKSISNQLRAGTNGSIYVSSGTGTLNGYYDTLLVSIGVAHSGSNFELGCYDDSSGPNNKLVQTTSQSGASTGDKSISVTEFQATTATLWLAIQVDDWTTIAFYGNNTGTLKSVSGSFGTFPNPFGSPATDNTQSIYGQISHS